MQERIVMIIMELVGMDAPLHVLPKQGIFAMASLQCALNVETVH